MNLIYNRNSKIFKVILLLAGIYGVLWGISAIFFPTIWFHIASLPHPNYPELFQTLGLFEFALGIAYILASTNPIRNWQIVLVGFIIKTCMVLGFFYFYYFKNEPKIIFQMILTNDIIWLLPFLLILYNTYKHEELLDNELIFLQNNADENFLELYTTNKGNNLAELSYENTVLLIFLRHFGCTFCKNTLDKINQIKSEVHKKDIKIVLVNMSSETIAEKHLQNFNLQDLDYVADEESLLYKAFQLNRGKFFQLFGLKVFIKGIYLWFSKKAFISSAEGADMYQMPGIFILKSGKIQNKFLYNSVADEPPLLELTNSINSKITNYC